MRFLRALLGHPALVIAVAAWAAVRPIVLPDRLPHADDLGFHLLRLAQLDHLWRQGVWFSRWAPDLAQGYGYPLLNYMAPLAYYAALPVRLLGFSIPTTLQITFALGMLTAGWGMYRLARLNVGRLPATAAAVAYLYAPYHLYDVHWRGNFGEALALAWLPWAFWAVGRLARSGDGRRLAPAAGFWAAVILSHNVSGLLATPLLFGYGVLEAWGAANGRRRRLALTTAAPALSLALAAFFWLPALLEQNVIALDRLMTNPYYQVTNHFQPWRELLALPPAVVPADLLNPSPVPSFGLIPALLGLSAWLGWGRLSADGRRALLFFTAVFGLILILLRPASLPIWQHAPLLQFLQFPWRLLAVGIVALPPLTGLAVSVLPARLHGPAVAAVAALLTAGSQLWLYPADGPKAAEVTVANIAPYEQATDTLGATAAGEYLPATVRDVPTGPPERLFETPDGRVVWEERRGVGAVARITAAQPHTVTANIFAFPGWQATVDGRPWPIAAAEPHGLIAVTLPAGEVELVLRFGETPLRLAADGISLATSAVVALLLLVWRPRLPRPTATPLPLPWALLLIGVGVGAGALWPCLRPTRLQADGALAGVTHPLALDFAGGLRLLGYDGPARAPADRPLTVALFWTTHAPPDRELWTTVALRDAEGVLWSDKKSINPTRFRPAVPTNAWSPGRYAEDRQVVRPLSGIPPGRYELIVTVFDRYTLAPLPLLGGVATQAAIGDVWIEQPIELPDFAPQYKPPAQTAAAAVRLLGYDLDRAAAQPGDVVLLTTFWEAGRPSADDAPSLLRRRLVTAEGESVWESIAPLPRPAEGRWRGRQLVRLPAALPGGVYRWQIAWCAGAVCAPDLQLEAPLTVDAPERLWAAPAVGTAVGRPIGPYATLLGATLRREGETIAVELVWRADALTTRRDRVFVHLLTETGELIAQSDGEPAGWTRPTTGWLPGEFVIDRHVLQPGGQAADGREVLVGLYDPENGSRPGAPTLLSLEDGE